MAYSYYNPNPVGQFVEDCVPRALSKALNTDWETAKVLISNASFKMADMEHSNRVWGAVLRQNGVIIDGIYDRLRNCPVGTTPVYGNQPIFTCPQTYGSNCGCGCNGGF